MIVIVVVAIIMIDYPPRHLCHVGELHCLGPCGCNRQLCSWARSLSSFSSFSSHLSSWRALSRSVNAQFLSQTSYFGYQWGVVYIDRFGQGGLLNPLNLKTSVLEFVARDLEWPFKVPPTAIRRTIALSFEVPCCAIIRGPWRQKPFKDPSNQNELYHPPLPSTIWAIWAIENT